MNLSQGAELLTLSGRHDNGENRRTEDDNSKEASSNVDYETNDVTIQPTPTIVDPNEMRESISTYEPLDNTTQVVRSQSLNSYEELNHDVWSEIFPIRGKQIIATSKHQPNSDVLHPKGTTQIHDPLSSQLFEQENGLQRQTDDNNTEWESSNDHYKTSGVLVQPTSIPTNHRQIQGLLSPYEALNITTQMIRFQNLKPYEQLNNDVWDEIFPVNGKQLKAIHLQQISDTSHENDKTQMNDPLNNSVCNETSQIILGNDPTVEEIKYISRFSLNGSRFVPGVIVDHPLLPVHPDLVNEEQSEELSDSTSPVVAALQSQIRTNLNEMMTSAAVGKYRDCTNEYESIPACLEPPMGQKERRITHSSTSRPLPVIPLTVCDPFNVNSRRTNANVLFSRQTYTSIVRMILVLTALVTIVVITLITVFLTTANDTNIGKLPTFRNMFYCYW